MLAERGATGLTTTSQHTENVRYLSYELVLSADACFPTTASDIYALGCIGLEVRMYCVGNEWELNHD
jgi:hypothetical protein